MVCPQNGTAVHKGLTLFGPQSCFRDKPDKLSVVFPKTGLRYFWKGWERRSRTGLRSIFSSRFFQNTKVADTERERRFRKHAGREPSEKFIPGTRHLIKFNARLSAPPLAFVVGKPRAAKKKSCNTPPQTIITLFCSINSACYEGPQRQYWGPIMYTKLHVLHHFYRPYLVLITLVPL